MIVAGRENRSYIYMIKKGGGGSSGGTYIIKKKREKYRSYISDRGRHFITFFDQSY
jgi:hypothetical protein